MYNVDVYQGAGSTLDEAGLGATVVLHMMVPLYDCNNHVYTDNFFSSISLANKLKYHGTLMILTARTNRRGWPKEMNWVKKLEKQMKQGESRSKIECIIWKDKRIVCIINNITPPSQAPRF